jgi:predicted RecA/RadA family phage recombinase
MAKNERFDEGRKLSLNVSAVNGSGAGDLVKSGDPGAVGVLPFVALTDEDADGLATVVVDGVYDLAVLGHDGTANAAIAVGDKVVWDNTGGTLEKTPGSGGSVAYGIALGAVSSGATTTIPVKIIPGI